MTRLLVLRPQPGADATAARAAAQGWQPVVHPLFRVVVLGWEPPAAEAQDAILMTSANAARHGGPGLAALRPLPLFAVGSATARAARDAGFTRIVTGDGDGAAAIALAHAAGHVRILHLCGRDHVAFAGTDRRHVYAAEPVTDAPPPADVALLHSARAARLYRSLLPDPATTAIAALSPAVAAAAGGGWKAVAIAQRPDDESLLAAAARLCDQGSQAGNKDQA